MKKQENAKIRKQLQNADTVSRAEEHVTLYTKIITSLRSEQRVHETEKDKLEGRFAALFATSFDF